MKDESLNYKISYKGFLWRFPIKDWHHMEVVYYPTFDEAYRAMMDNEVVDDSIVYSNSQQGYTFGYQISRLGFDPHGTRDFYIQYWQYDSEKREFDRSSCSSYHFNMPGSYGKYLGRFPENIRFKEGDIVEIGISRYEDAGKCYSTLGIVIGTPRTVREQWEWNEEAGINELAEKGEPNPIEKYYEEPDSAGVDIEEYFILYGPYEESMRFATFQPPLGVRPPTFDVPEEAKETLKNIITNVSKALKMTKEEFYKLAAMRPEMPESSIYRLTIFTYDRNNKSYHKSEDDEWVLNLEAVSPMYFSSREKAEESLANAADELIIFQKMHSAIIERLPIDTGFRQMSISWWMYDKDGKMIDHSVCSSFHTFDKRTPAGKFFGRRNEEIRFKEGDFVEVYDVDPLSGQIRVKIDKIVHGPNTVDEEWEGFDKSQQEMGEYPFEGFYISDYFRDSLADNYLTGHFDENAVKNVFSLTFSIPQEVKDEINHEIEVFQTAERCIALYENISGEEMDKLYRGELTEEDIRKTHKCVINESSSESY